jgi:hypothetical protein
MPLTITTTVGGASANSYSDVATADAAALYRVGSTGTAWTALTSDQKIQALVTATRDIDTLLFKGDRASSTQALEWPRTGTDYAATVLPAPLVNATVELAFSYAPAFAVGATIDPLNPDTSAARIKEDTVGPITTVYFEPAPAPDVYGAEATGLERFPGIVQRLLAPLVWLAAVNVWGSAAVVRSS